MENDNNKVVYKELSYKIMGVLFDINREVGFGYKEKFYEKAIAVGLKNKGIKFCRQVPYSVTFEGEVIGRHFLDFLIEDKIILEIKAGNHFSRQNFSQVLEYLNTTNLKLAILANFTPTGVKFKRVLNTY